jgi:hypothetical protein
VIADSAPVIAAPSMWTRPQIKDFKEKIRQDADSVITVGRGEVVTVRVPTHEEGSYLFWEFATDYYDIGFGVFFEWTDAASASVSVHVSESSDEDEDEEGGTGDDEGCVEDGANCVFWMACRSSGSGSSDYILFYTLPFLVSSFRL